MCSSSNEWVDEEDDVWARNYICDRIKGHIVHSELELIRNVYHWISYVGIVHKELASF